MTFLRLSLNTSDVSLMENPKNATSAQNFNESFSAFLKIFHRGIYRKTIVDQERKARKTHAVAWGSDHINIFWDYFVD